MLEEKLTEMSNKGISRRGFLTGAGAALGGFAAGGLFGFNETKALAAVTPPWSYPTGGLDVDLVKKRAFDGYYGGGCCYGAAKGLIDTLREQSANNPWLDLPTDMFKWGAGGGLAWGTICGALNGSLPVVNLLVPSIVGKFSDALLSWYSGTAFPLADPMLDAYITSTKPSVAGFVIPTSVCNSPLCHASVSTWCGVSGKGVNSDEKKLRCARLTADTAGKTAELLNIYFASGNAPAGVTFEAATASCMDCHNGMGTSTATGLPKRDDEQGKMTCGECHVDGGKNIAPGCTKP